MRRSAGLVLLAAALLAGCSTPIGVTRVTAQEVRREMMANALSAAVPSQWSLQVLHRDSLFERHQADPQAALDGLYRLLRQQDSPRRLFALAELSFLYAQRYERRDYYLAAAVFAYAFLLPDDEQLVVPGTDPRVRLAVDIYNQALAEGLASPEPGQVRLEPANVILPFGELAVTIDPSQLLWAGYRFKRFVPASHLQVRGLRNRYRRPGVGAPLVADIEPAGPGAGAAPVHNRIPPGNKVPLTAFLRIEQPLQAVLEGRIQARLELYTPDNAVSVRVGARDVPLEVESSAAIAYLLEGAPVWDTEISRFRFAEAPLLGDGLMLLQPHRPGRIPVVFVHGTASSPARWAEMYNELSNDPVLRDRFQFWMFQYHTGQPVLYSALQLRRGVRSVLDEIDPQRRDPALRRMVVIGHSQGGLLAKLMAVASGTRFWDNLTPVPFEQFDAPADAKALFGEAMFFEPVPELERVVFIATPHRGSYRSGGVVQAIVRRLITLPSRLVQNVQAFNNLPTFSESGMAELPTAVDNMTPDTRFIKTLETLPFGPRIRAHSIVAVLGPGPPDELDDGVVKYRSAHIEGVESELVVRSSHSTQAVPETIEEVRRILREHLGSR